MHFVPARRLHNQRLSSVIFVSAGYRPMPTRKKHRLNQTTYDTPICFQHIRFGFFVAKQGKRATPSYEMHTKGDSTLEGPSPHDSMAVVAPPLWLDKGYCAAR